MIHDLPTTVYFTLLLLLYIVLFIISVLFIIRNRALSAKVLKFLETLEDT